MAEDKPIPHIEVSVEYKGERASLNCSHFIDGISFLCGCERSIREKENMKEPIDIRTSVFQKSNLDKLLELTKNLNGENNNGNDINVH